MYIGGRRGQENVSGFEGSQAVFTRPSGKGNAYDQN
jgi:hypothetical protein